jgi:hypothetical protein
VGQKSTYTAWAGEMICAGLAEGHSLLATCEALGIAYPTARLWEEENPEHAANATRARAMGCHALADQALAIADTPRLGIVRTTKADGSIEERQEDMTAHRRLQIDTRKWLLAKWLPKVYGDKLELAGELTHKKAAADMTDDELLALAKGRKP